MSQQDVQTIREGYDAFNRQDIPGVLERFDPQIEWNEPGGGRAPAGIFHGAQEIAGKVFALVPENFDEFSADAQQFIDAGEHVVVVGRFRGRAKHGAVLDAPFVHVWKMLNGKAARFYHHVEQSAWTKAWGGSYRLALTRMVPDCGAGPHRALSEYAEPLSFSPPTSPNPRADGSSRPA